MTGKHISRFCTAWMEKGRAVHFITLPILVQHHQYYLNMTKHMMACLSLLLIFLGACQPDKEEVFVFVAGGLFPATGSAFSNMEIEVTGFYMGKYEITQKEWERVMGSNPSNFQHPDFPVEMVSWYDCMDYCNRRSIMEGLEPYYVVTREATDPINWNEYDTLKRLVDVNPGASGYRLPTEVEWEYAASGGQESLHYRYSGSNEVTRVAWFWRNSGTTYLEGEWDWERVEKNKGSVKAVGLLQPNELGLYDMSGNVREWCQDWFEDQQWEKGYGRVWRGGGWLGGEHACAVDYRGLFEANGKGADQGFRIVRNK